MTGVSVQLTEPLLEGDRHALGALHGCRVTAHVQVNFHKHIMLLAWRPLARCFARIVLCACLALQGALRVRKRLLLFARVWR